MLTLWPRPSIVRDLSIENSPKFPSVSASISPPWINGCTAREKVRQGVANWQSAVSLPLWETHVRATVPWADPDAGTARHASAIQEHLALHCARPLSPTAVLTRDVKLPLLHTARIRPRSRA